MAGTDGLAFDEAASSVQFVRWIFGWNLLVSWGMITVIVGGTGYLVGVPYLAGLVGFLAGPPIWFYETRYINSHYEPLYEAYFEDLEVVGPKVLKAAGAAEDVDFFTLRFAPDSSPLLVEPAQQYDAAVLAVGDSTVWIYDDATLDLMFLDGDFGTDTDVVEAIDFEDLEAVSYEDQALEFHTIDEETVRVASSTEPAEALDAIRTRLADVEAEE